MTKVGGKKVFVGLSGGVDSAVSAALLKQNGYDVTAVFIKVWQPDWIECNWKEERKEAMRVAAHLNIPFFTLDLVKEYKRGVIDYMISEYCLGRTPNPDVMCNREVKFGAFWQWAKSKGADYVATGHYAQRVPIISSSARQSVFVSLRSTSRKSTLVSACDGNNRDANKDCGYKMLAGNDANKDQSYFLWTLNQNDLSHTLFPVGHLQKSEVRELAKKFDLPNAEKKDSQGLCFIGKVDVKEFLAHYIDTRPGNVLSENGTIIGTHSGALFFTIGERRGFTITAKSPSDRPYYVISKDMDANTITVSDRTNLKEKSQHITTISRINWTGKFNWQKFQTADKNKFPLQARIRYRQELQNIKILSEHASALEISFEKKQDTLTSGQSLVIYNGNECLGGGIID